MTEYRYDRGRGMTGDGDVVLMLVFKILHNFDRVVSLYHSVTSPSHCEGVFVVQNDTRKM